MTESGSGRAISWHHADRRPDEQHVGVPRVQAPFAESKLRPLLSRVDFSRVRRVLDVGCGPGTNARHFKNVDYTGLDINEGYIADARRRLSYEALVRDHPRLYLAGKWQSLSWLPQRLKDDGWAIEQIGGHPQAPVFEARRSR